MKVKILSNLILANYMVSKPHLDFNKDEVIEIYDERVLERLFSLNAAVEVKEPTLSSPTQPEIKDVIAKKAMLDKTENKLFKPKKKIKAKKRNKTSEE